MEETRNCIRDVNFLRQLSSRKSSRKIIPSTEKSIFNITNTGGIQLPRLRLDPPSLREYK